MKNARPVWLASYPRSGNTLLRTILWHCFELRSASVYPHDLGGNQALENYVGHREHGPDGRIHFSADEIPLIKTHTHPTDDSPAIYVVRDGRAACVSLWEFYGRKTPLAEIIRGQHRFGTWSDHVVAWSPWNRTNTLLVRYEDIVGSLAQTLKDLAQFLGRKPIGQSIPSRSSVVAADGQWVRKKSTWQNKLTHEQLDLFEQVNGNVMRKLNYFP